MNQKRTNLDAATAVRAEKGIMLVEMLVAVLVLSILMAGVMQGLSQVMTTGTQSQNQVIAANIVQELVDQARNASWATLTAPGNADGNFHNIGVYSPAMGQPAYLPRNLLYAGTTTAAAGNQFRGTVQQRLSNLGNGQVQLTIQISWPSETGGGNRTLNATSYISQWGIHN